MDPCLAFVRKNCKEIVPTSDINLPVSLLNTLWSLMDEFREAKVGGIDGVCFHVCACEFCIATMGSAGSPNGRRAAQVIGGG